MAYIAMVEDKMVSVKVLGSIIALITLVIVIAPVSAYSFYGLNQMGSSFDANQISMTSSLGLANVGTFTFTPSTTYSFSVKGIGQQPTFGSLSSYANFDHMSASEHLTISETTTASGIIYDFSKSISATL
jgi:hypothetical protein